MGSYGHIITTAIIPFFSGKNFIYKKTGEGKGDHLAATKIAARWLAHFLGETQPGLREEQWQRKR
jgi:hypothetical protein